MLVDEQDGNVLALRGEAVKGGLDGSVVCLCVDDEEVLLRVGWRRYVLGSVSVSVAAWPCIGGSTHANAGKQHARHRVLRGQLADGRGEGGGSGRGSITCLVTDDGEELPVFVCSGRGHGGQSWVLRCDM
jgi:hypothetical protein